MTADLKAAPEKEKLHYPTIVISDAHLGKDVSKAAELLEFLNNISCDKLIINGDLIDGWRLMAKKHKKLPEMHLRALDRINEMAASGTEVVYIAGNHDENLRANWDREARAIRAPSKKRPASFLDKDFEFYDPNQESRFSIRVCDTYDYTDPTGRKIHFLHGDQFEPKFLKTKLGRAIAKKGDGFYDAFINFDEARAQKKKMKRLSEKLEGEGKHFSLAKYAKHSAKEKFKINEAFRSATAKIAERGYQGVGVGHNHAAEIREDEDGLYLNSGDWVESNTALACDREGNWRLIEWQKERIERGLEAEPTEKDENLSAAYRPITEKQLRAMQWIWQAKDTAKRRAKIRHAKNKVRKLTHKIRQNPNKADELQDELARKEKVLHAQVQEFTLY